MRSAWLLGLVVFTLTASGFILVQGRDGTDPAALGEALAEEAREGVQEVASDLGLPTDPSEPPRSTGTFYGYTDASGNYTLGYLVPGTHYARTFASFYLNELYDNIPCPAWCDVTAGTGHPAMTRAARLYRSALERSSG